MRAWIIGAAMLAAGPASAWWEAGHEVVCEIAFAELTEPVRAEVVRLIALDPLYDTFPASCSWADRGRMRSTEHYVNVPRDMVQFMGDPCPLGGKCVVSAITGDSAVLRSSGDDAQKLAALKFLGHWVGDIHQPMHAGFADDRGANGVDVSGRCSRNLHAAWDGCLVEKAVGTDPLAAAATLRAEVKPEERELWISSGPMEWANESLAVARSPSTRYCDLEGDLCGYMPGNPTLDAGEPHRLVEVDDAYVAANVGIVRLRLKQAGIRLGALLNRALGGL